MTVLTNEQQCHDFFKCKCDHQKIKLMVGYKRTTLWSDDFIVNYTILLTWDGAMKDFKADCNDKQTNNVCKSYRFQTKN